MAAQIDQLQVEQSHSRKAIAKATGLAFLAAGLLLVTVVLPAEYGIDPLGTGRVLGLTGLSEASAAAPVVPPPQGAILAPVQEGNVALYPGEYKVDSREFVLGPYEYIEYKYSFAQDATMLFSWSATGDVLQEFHGDADRPSASQSYDKSARRKADGSFIAPFSGIHGWYWENPGGEPVTVKIITAGFYAAAYEFPFNGTRQAREVRGLNAISGNDN